MKNPNTPIQYIKGVGPRKAKVLTRLGIETVSDMLYYLPFRYEDRSTFTSISELEAGTLATIKGSVKSSGNIRTRSGIIIFQLVLDDGTGVIHALWFNQPYLNKLFKAGQRIVMYGKVERYDRLRMNHPQYEILGDEDTDSIHVGRIVPIYHLTKSLTQRNLRAMAYRAVSEYPRSFPDMLPTKLRARNKLVDVNFSIGSIHFPTSFENQKRAYRRIVFDEFFILQLAIAVKRREAGSISKGISHAAGKGICREFIDGLPFELTKGQKKTIRAIEKDMASSRPMNRLIQGDVGSGKTVVAAYALLLTVENGHQGALMAPTEILAEQHYVTLSKMLMRHNVNVTLLIQGLSREAKRGALEEIKSGRADIVIGTHALIQEGVEFDRLALVVIDEQHKFGVSQRARFHAGEKTPDTLLMTATPIPRTLALTVYGDLDISVIKELPPGRGDVTTYWIANESREKVYNFMREEVSKGRQAYVVYPRIEESDSLGVMSARSMHEELKERIFKDFEVELIHGRMEPSKKDSIMSGFKKGDIDILVSTVVIEVGIDIPNASVMVVENAEMFGLSQLHQLRGRIGRGPYESYCVLMSDAPTENAERRLSAMTGAQDGFEIAEEDLKLRGPGDIFGTKQHGLPEVRAGDVVGDMEIMELARREAFSLIERDPELTSYENRHIKKNLYKRFEGKPNLVGVG